VPETGSYQVNISYKMRYKDKDFIIGNKVNELAFSLKGKGQKVEKVQSFDGNEQTISVKMSSKKSVDYVQSHVGVLNFTEAGIQKVTLKQGQIFELKASTKEFKAQDQRYRAMNIDIEEITLVPSY
jgi:alpha-L-fucosidase